MKELFKENRINLGLKIDDNDIFDKDIGVHSADTKSKARQNIKIKLI